jgi:uncharacterized protein
MKLPTMASGWAVLGSPPCDQPGAPAWVDFGTVAGTSAAARFYCSLFGWRVVARHRPLDDSVGYWVFSDHGTEIAGLGPAREAAWTVYVAVTDLDATALAVTAGGGSVVFGPTTVDDLGRMALCQDPEGATFAIWQGDQAPQPGSMASAAAAPTSPGPACFQLVCRDVERATRFYEAVFGWTAGSAPGPADSAYVELHHPFTRQPVAGVVEIDERWDDVRAHWTAPFTVADLDDCTTRAAALGGRVSVAPFDVPRVGRMAVLNDPEHAPFAVMQAA